MGSLDQGHSKPDIAFACFTAEPLASTDVVPRKASEMALCWKTRVG
jgi:hypothetical protein